MDFNVGAQLNIRHALRSDENELPAHTSSRSLNHHFHADIAIDIIHENVELVQAPDGRSHGLPKREEQTNGAEGLFAAA